VTFLPRNRLIGQSKAKENVMKKDVAIAIALILLGGLGLVYPLQFGAHPNSSVPKHARLLGLQPVAVISPLYHTVSVPQVQTVACSRSDSAARRPNLFQKMSAALAELDSVVSLQSIGSGS
jgi:hypothetical protein